MDVDAQAGGASEHSPVPEARLAETRTFAPPAAFTAQANVDASVYATADADPIAFWEHAAKRLPAAP